MAAVTKKTKSCHVEDRLFGLACSCSGCLSFKSDKNEMQQTHCSLTYGFTCLSVGLF